MMNFELLMEQVKEITNSGLPIMEGKEKLETEKIINDVVTVDDYGFLQGNEGEFVVITLKEYPTKFIYGSSVVTENFKKLQEKFDAEQIAYLLNNDFTIKLSQVVSQNKRKYTKVTFFPKQ